MQTEILNKLEGFDPERGYQYDFSDTTPLTFDSEGRQKKAMTMVSILSEYMEKPLKHLSVLNVGASAGIIDEYLSRYFGKVIGIDIDEKAILFAQKNFQREGLFFEVNDAMDIKYGANTFDVLICTHVYEHVPDAFTLVSELYRVLKPGGLVYFAASNRIRLIEPHYKLPFLSLLPRPLSHLYMKLSGKGVLYYEKHLSYWGLKKLVNMFEIVDYTPKILASPKKYKIDYMIRPGSLKHKIACFIAKKMSWLFPSYIWLLKKPTL